MRSIAGQIDHTLLRPEATTAEIEEFARLGLEHPFAAVITHSAFLDIPLRILRDADVRVGTVVDFCFGSAATAQKIYAAADSVRRGADDIDLVINNGWLKSGLDKEVEKELKAVVAAVRGLEREFRAGKGPVIIKVIIECGLLTEAEKIRACKLVKVSGADFVKTSTGYLSTGAQTADVALMRSVVGPDFGVKASGGIRNLSQARAMLAAGADRIGTSSAAAIVLEERKELERGA